MTGRTVPELPVLLTLAVVVLLLEIRRLRRRGVLTAGRLGVAVAAAVYVAGVVWQVLFPFPVRVGADRDGMAPWTTGVQLVPFYDHEPSSFVLNVLLFLPLGVLLPLVSRVRTAGRVVLAGFLTSLTIETLQFVLARTVTSGHVAEVDDLLANTLGALLGWLVLRALLAVPAGARLAAEWLTVS